MGGIREALKLSPNFVSLADPELEKARAAAQAATAAPANKAAAAYVTERNSKRDRVADIPLLVSNGSGIHLSQIPRHGIGADSWVERAQPGGEGPA